jgi:flagellar M-ring protein FliF
MEFEAVSLGSTELASLPWLSAARAVELAAVTGILLLGLAAILAARSAIGRREAEPEGAPADGAATGLPAPDLGVPPALGAQTASSFEPIGQEMEASPPMLGVQAIAGEPDGVRDGGTQLDPVERLQQLITERREETVEVLRGWIEGTHETGPAAQDDRRGVVQ